MRCLARLRVYVFGNLFLHQVSGIPIGGPVSGAILESVLCVAEHNFDHFRWKRFAHEVGLRGKREQWVTLLRYVDDVLSIRFWFCPTCLRKLIDEIYRDTVCFDTSNDGECSLNGMNGLKFLDLWVFVGWCKTKNIFLVNKNDLYAFSGIGSLLVKTGSTSPAGHSPSSPTESPMILKHVLHVSLS